MACEDTIRQKLADKVYDEDDRARDNARRARQPRGIGQGFEVPLLCEWCVAPYLQKRPVQRYCSEGCQKLAQSWRLGSTQQMAGTAGNRKPASASPRAMISPVDSTAAVANTPMGMA